MYTSALFTAILAGSALALHPVTELVKRQTLTPDIIPSQCQDTCTSTLPIYNACLSGDQDTCLTVCDDANFDPFVACFNCIIQNVPGGTSGQFQQAQQLIDQLEQACGQDSSSASGSSNSVTRTSSGVAGGVGASFTSATSGVTIGGGSSTGSGALASITSSLGGAASSASEAVAGSSSTPSASQSGAGAQSSAPNAGVVNAPNGLAALILGAIGALAL